MKVISRIIIVFISLFMVVCTSKKSENSNELTPYTGYDFDFLLGEWNRTNDEDGKRTFENWKKGNDSTYIGESFTLKDNDTIWKENTVLSPIDGIWYYQVKMPGEKESTNFKVIAYESNAFTCENRQNEFPKMIRYWKTDQILNAEIADDEMKIPFIFEK